MARSAFLGTLLAICIVASGRQLWAQSAEVTASSYVRLGDDFAADGEFKLAIGAYTVAIDYAPSLSVAYYRRGVAHQNRGELSLALTDFTRTIELSPEFVDALATRGYLFGLQKDMKKALAD
jgi:tetratricopeptide (TPR) repeat protein